MELSLQMVMLITMELVYIVQNLYTDINRQSKIFLIILFLFKLTLLRTGLRNLPTISNCPKIGQFRKVKIANF